jgi:hypothetical protein
MGSTVHINREAADSLRLVNTTGVALVAGEFTIMRGKGLVALEAIASLAEDALENVYDCRFQVADFAVGEAAFAAADLPVYWDPTTKVFSNVATVGHYLVGHSLAAKDSAGVLDVIGCDPILVVDSVATLAAAVEALDDNAETAQATITISLNDLSQEDGTALTKQASTVAGFLQLADKEVVLDIPVNCTAGESLQFTTSLPQDLDDAADIAVHVLAGKAANLDALTLDCEVYPCAVGDTANADIQDTAAQTITQAASELVFVCGADGVLPAPGTLTVVLALGGTNDGDAVYIYGVWVEYKRAILTA